MLGGQEQLILDPQSKLKEDFFISEKIRVTSKWNQEKSKPFG